MRKILSKYSVFELIIIAMIAALGIAVKPVVSPLVRVITGPVGVPGGVLAGGIYMMFLVLARGVTRRWLAGTLTAIVQALIVLLSGVGSHGPMTLVTYIMPGVAVDLIVFVFERFNNIRAGSTRPKLTASACFCAGIAANVTGSFLVSIALFNIPIVPLLLALSVSALSGGLGGLLAFSLLGQIYKLELLVNSNED